MMYVLVLNTDRQNDSRQGSKRIIYLCKHKI